MPPDATRHGGLVAPDPPPAQRETEPALLHAVFERTARAHPAAVAIEVPPSAGRPARVFVTYSEVRDRAAALAARLAPLVPGECVVAIALPRDSAAIYIAQLAVMESGAAYTCLAPDLAPERARFLLEDSRAVAVLARESDRERFETLGVARERIVVVDENGAATGPAGSSNGRARPHAPSPSSLAYVIYTSGTSGRPKGVMIEHRSIVNLVESDRRYFRLGPGDRVAQNSSCAYDSSIEEIWLAFGSGATLVLMDDDAVRLGPDLVPWLRDERIAVFCPPPTLLRMVSCEDPARALPDLRLLYVGGEELPADVAARWAPGRRLENGYGPTECSVTVVRTPVRAGEPVTIGWPVDGNQAWVLDEDLGEVEPGAPGELCIGGAGVARGYLNQPALTAERFVEHPRFGRLYRTGDLVERRASGALAYLGRSDSQVKVRGHRVELSAIEAHLCACDGVVAAACALQGELTSRELSAFLVTDAARPAEIGAVRARMRAAVPDYMQPVHYAFVAELPTRDASGKLDRSALPDLWRAARAAGNNGHAEAAPQATRPASGGTALERAIAAAFAEHVPYRGAIALGDDFFLDLGGNSLIAAQVVSALRRDPATASLTVRDVYEARTVAGLAARAAAQAPAATHATETAKAPDAGFAGATSPGALAQLAWVGASLVPRAGLAWAAVFVALPALERAVGAVPLLLALPLVAFAAELAWLLPALLLTAGAKALLVGRYRPGRHAYLGSFHVRHWMVVQLARSIPWSLVQGTELGNACLRALGARIGRNVHVHRGVDLAGGGWDLLDLGDGATLGRDASLGVAEFRARELVLAPVAIGAGATLDTRAHVSGGASLGRDAYLGCLSMLPAGAAIPDGERWEGVPAVRVGDAPPAAESGGEAWPAAAHAATFLAVRAVAPWLALLPGLLLAVAFLRPGAPGTGLLPAPFGALPLAFAPLLLVAGYAMTLPMEALLVRALGRVREGAHRLRSWTGIAIVMKEQAIETANGALSGTLLWPWWLRAAGARVGRKCEISTIMEGLPELLEIGDECFFADGIYLGRSRLHRGLAECRRTRLSRNTFLGNHVVVPAGVSLPPDILLGICTVADPDAIRGGTSWFGQPPLELPRREVAASERELTHDPGPARLLTRVVFESARLVLPLVPLALAWGWFRAAPAWRAAQPDAQFFLVTLPLSVAALGAVLCALALATKWLVLGPIREGRHALWSCWCCRWDILFEVWAAYAVPVLAAFEGTPFVAWWLRGMGCRIGRGVVFGSSFLQVVDPDMLEIGDGATVSCHLQSHSFEDRVLKLAPVRIGAGADVNRGAVLLYGADIGERAEVAENSVVMKREMLLPGRRYSGCPTRPVTAGAGR